VDLIFRERAFWLFSTGHRVGDLRRLIKFYQRSAESVFPTGEWHKGGPYGPDVNFPVPQAEETNPNVIPNNTCTDRKA
jgi:starch-binding outer membrane protein, SusD/RagB family